MVFIVVSVCVDQNARPWNTPVLYPMVRTLNYRLLIRRTNSFVFIALF